MPFDPKSNSLTPIKVLLIEDDAAQQWLVAHFLNEQPDIVCVTASDGPEGLRKAWAENPQVILLDLILPGMDGMELLRQYKAANGPAEVIVLSRAGHESISDLAFSLGARYFFLKPYSLQQLLPHSRALGAGPDRKYELLLLKMGANPQWKGFRQAARCAALLSRDREELLKVIHLQAARELGVEAEHLDINIRRLIDSIHTAGAPFYRQFLPSPEKKKPTPKEFLLLLIEAARIPL